MGLFDVGIRKQISSQKSKEEILATIEKKIKVFSEETSQIKNNTLLLNSFKSSILKYNLSINLEKTKNSFSLSIDGELQQFYVLILLTLIILSILFTLGIGIIFIVGFTYLQKHFTTKIINSLLDKI